MEVTRKFFSRAILYLIVLFFAPAIVALAMFEGWMRYDLHKRVIAHFDGMPLWLQNQTLTASHVDKLTGNEGLMIDNGLLKINTNYDLALEVSGTVNLNFSVRTNNLGLLSDLPVSVPRDSSNPEFRILMFGDSLTGTVTANYQWVDTVQELLGKDKGLRQALGGRQIRVYNLGMVAAGFRHFFDYYEKAGKQLDADLLVINFTYDDFPRRHVGPRFENEAEMVDQAAEALQLFRSTGKPLLVTQMPLYFEMFPEKTGYKRTLLLEKKLPGLSVVDMRDHLPTHYGAGFAKQWYNLPYDHHMSDFGGEFYARAMAKVIAKTIEPNQIRSFLLADSKYFAPADCLPKATNGRRQPPQYILFDIDSTQIPIKVREAPVNLGRYWFALAGGTGSGGAATVSFGEFTLSADKRRIKTLTFNQTHASSYGSPSLSNTQFGATALAGESVEIRFYAKASGTRSFSISITRTGNLDKKTVTETVENLPFTVGSDWTEIVLPVSISKLPAGFQAGSSDKLKFQIIPNDPSAIFQLDLTEIVLTATGTVWALAEHPSCATRLRDETSVSQVITNPTLVNQLRHEVKAKLGHAKIWSLKPYATMMAFKKINPLIPPLSHPMKGGFAEVQFGDRRKMKAYLNIFCLSEPVELTNPDCFTNQHFFIQ